MVRCIQIPDIIAVSIEVCMGLYGNGEERKKKINEAGFDYEKVRKCVNKLYPIYKEYWNA